MNIANNDSQRVTNAWRNSPWLPAILLITVQLVSGMRDMPQYAFFVIYLQESMHLQPLIISSVIAGAQVAGMITALLGGVIAMRIGSKWVLVIGLTCLGLSSFAFQAPTFGLAAACWFISGAGTALASVGGASYLTQISSRGGLGLLAAFYALSMTAGGAIGNPLAGILIEQYGYIAFSRTAIAISAALILLVILLMPQFEKSKSASLSLASIWKGLITTSAKTNVRFLVGMRSLPTIFYAMLGVLIPLMINSLTGSKVTVAIYGTTNLVMASLAQLLVGRAADRWGARIPTVAAYTALVLSGIGLALTNNTVWGLFGFGVLGIAAAWSLSTLMYIWVNDGVPKDEHPSTFGLLHSIWSLSMVSGSILGGWFVASIPGLPFLTGAILNVGSVFLGLQFYQHIRSANAQGKD